MSKKRRSLQECLDLIGDVFKDVPTPASNTVAVEVACGSVLAEDVLSPIHVPEFRTSIVDGYACSLSTKLNRRIGVTVTWTGRSFAGQEPSPSGDMGQNCVHYVSTGAKLPQIADFVIPIEYVTCGSDPTRSDLISVKYPHIPVAGTNVREIGSDTRRGDVVVHKGTRLSPADISVLTACKVQHVKVYLRLKIGICSTGREVLSGQIGDANKAYLWNKLVNDFSMRTLCDVTFLGTFEDHVQSFTEIAKRGHAFDIMISTGSVSKGITDRMRSGLQSAGYTILFDQVNLKPGKPTTVGYHGEPNKRVVFFALPGNPASCFATFNLMVVPHILFRSGAGNGRISSTRAVLLSTAITPDPERPEYLRAVAGINGGQVSAMVISGSQRSSRMASCNGDVNCLLMVPAGKEVVAPGTALECIPLLGHDFKLNEGFDSARSYRGNANIVAKIHAFEKLIDWLQQRTDVQNIDMMDLAGFCRNCLAKWMHQGDAHLSIDDAKQIVYGMSYDDWKKKYQTELSQSGQQLALVESASKRLRAEDTPPKAIVNAPSPKAPPLKALPVKFGPVYAVPVKSTPTKARASFPPAPTSNPCGSSVGLAPAPVPNHSSALPLPLELDGEIFLEVLTVSDRAYKGVYADTAGPLAVQIMRESGLIKGLPTFYKPEICADDREHICERILDFSDEYDLEPLLLIVTGGTGHAERDVTPEAVIQALDKRSTGLEHLLLSRFIQLDPVFALTRAVIGTVRRTLVISLPGRPEAVKAGLNALMPALRVLIPQLQKQADISNYKAEFEDDCSCSEGCDDFDDLEDEKDFMG